MLAYVYAAAIGGAVLAAVFGAAGLDTGLGLGLGAGGGAALAMFADRREA